MTIISGESYEFVQLPGRRSADPLADVDAASSVRVVRLEHTPGRHAHRHPHTEEIVFVRSGRGAVWIDGERRSVGPGDVVHIGAGTPHATLPAPDAPMELVCFFPHPTLSINIEELDIVVHEEDE